MKYMISGLAAILATMSILAAPQVHAGAINKNFIHCADGFKRYELEWFGGWSEERIFMQRKCSWRGDWDYDFWIGYLDPSGSIFPAALDYTHRMMAQPVSSTAYVDSNLVTVGSMACGGVTP